MPPTTAPPGVMMTTAPVIGFEATMAPPTTAPTNSVIDRNTLKLSGATNWCQGSKDPYYRMDQVAAHEFVQCVIDQQHDRVILVQPLVGERHKKPPGNRQ